MLKPNLSTYTSMHNRIVLDEPEIDKMNGSIVKTEASIIKEKENWIKEGKPLRVAKSYISKEGDITLNEGDFVILEQNIYGMIRIEFEDKNRWQVPITSIAGKIEP